MVRDLTRTNEDRLTVWKKYLNSRGFYLQIHNFYRYIRSSIQELKCSRAEKTKASIVDIVSPRRFILKFNNIKTWRSFSYLLQGALAMMEFMKKRRVVIARDDIVVCWVAPTEAAPNLAPDNFNDSSSVSVFECIFLCVNCHYWLLVLLNTLFLADLCLCLSCIVSAIVQCNVLPKYPTAVFEADLIFSSSFLSVSDTTFW